MAHKRSDQLLNSVLHALSDPTRRAILSQVAQRSLTVKEIAARHHMTVQAVSKHLQVLEKAELISKIKDGRLRHCRMNTAPLVNVVSLVEHYRALWEARLDVLERLVDKTSGEPRIMAARSNNDLVIRRMLNADRKSVFRVLTDPEMMSQWFFPGAVDRADVENDFKVGGSYRLDMHTSDGETYSHTGTYLEIEPPERLVFTWNSPIVKETIVSILLREVEGRTEIILTHAGLVEDDIREMHRGGWKGCLDNLTRFVAGR